VRVFDDAERADIGEALVDAGEEYFIRVGPHKTTVAGLTDEVGIAKGSFYSFSDSKGERFLEVFVRLRDGPTDVVLTEADGVEGGRVGIERLFRAYVEWLADHPSIEKRTADVDTGRFRRSLPAEELAAAEREGVQRLVPVVETWQENGSLRDDVAPAAVVGLVEPVALLAATNDEYDRACRRQRDLAIETNARGLVEAGVREAREDPEVTAT
jgi:AcrR family transcriptional regulator